MEMIHQFSTKIFADSADMSTIKNLNENAFIKGFTTNPSLMHKAGISDYKAFALAVLKVIQGKPISFEVFSDNFEEMYYQAQEIASWGENVYVKIPVSNTKGESSKGLIRHLAKAGIKQNVTAILTLKQVEEVSTALAEGPSAYISVFAGRIADTGRDPLPIIRSAIEIMRPCSQLELIWASPRELLNIFQADQAGCHIITVTQPILKKLEYVDKNLDQYSLETVKMFYNDALQAGFEFKSQFRPKEKTFDFTDYC